MRMCNDDTALHQAQPRIVSALQILNLLCTVGTIGWFLRVSHPRARVILTIVVASALLTVVLAHLAIKSYSSNQKQHIISSESCGDDGHYVLMMAEDNCNRSNDLPAGILRGLGARNRPQIFKHCASICDEELMESDQEDEQDMVHLQV
jgi:hypothetical protein